MILFIAKAGKQHGIGHLKRVISLINITEEKTMLLIFTDSASEHKFTDRIKQLTNGILNVIVFAQYYMGVHFAVNFIESILIQNPFPTIKLQLKNNTECLQEKITEVVLDMREVEKPILELFIDMKIPIISFGDYKYAVKLSEATVCPLPYHKIKNANFEDISYQPFDKCFYGFLQMPPLKSQLQNILISFGGSDEKNIALGVVNAILATNNGRIPDDMMIILIEGPLADYEWSLPIANVYRIQAPASIDAHIHKSDIVFTTVGLTLIQALAMKKKVITINPTPYHDKIANTIDGIINLGYLPKVDETDVVAAIKKTIEPVELDFDSKHLYKWWNTLIANTNNQQAECPICGSSRREAIQRTELFTLFVCKNCQSNYQYRLAPSTVDYEEIYFEDKYREAYGKSYNEDIENIRKYSARRLGIIKNILPNISKPRLLDIGSGLGVFVDEAGKHNFKATGVEISDYAAKFSREKFGTKIVKSLDDVNNNVNGKFDVITMWFFLEHIPDPHQWLKKAKSLLKDGGILALGLPNSTGAFARKNTKDYVKVRPEEHYFEPSYKAIIKILKGYDFTIKHTKFFGLHPRRYGMPDWQLVKFLQRLLHRGDTFEIYFVLRKHP